MENRSSTTHPMVIVAAAMLTLASMTAIASFAGWLPVARVAEPTPAVSSAAQATKPPAAKVRKTSPPASGPADRTIDEVRTRRVASSEAPVPTAPPINDSGIAVEAARPAAQSVSGTSAVCRECATIEAIREIKQEGQGTGLGAVGGGVLGGLLGNQIGKGSGRTVGAVLGALGGAYAGHEVEKKVRATTQYEITLRLDDGTTRVLTQNDAPAWVRGDRVRFANGQIGAL